MSSNLKYKQVAQVSRRTWDTEVYEKKAKERSKQAEEASSGKHNSNKSSSHNNGPNLPASSSTGGADYESKEEFVPAAAGAAGPMKSKRAFLKARKSKVDVDSKIGTTEFVNPEAAAAASSSSEGGATSIKDGVTKTGVGWHCKVCDCFLKDSIAYLDHINGRKHQRNLGYSMRVERSTASQVNDVLARLTKEKEKQKDPLLAEELSKPTNYEDVVKQKDEEERLRKEERARKRKERRKKKKEEEPVAEEEEEAEEGDGEEEVEEGGIDPAMAAMMGFSGFGGGNKNH